MKKVFLGLSSVIVFFSCGIDTGGNNEYESAEGVFNRRESSLEEVIYKTVKIGSQEWMVENLNVGTFRNGDPIPQAETKKEWYKAGGEKQAAWGYYDNKYSNGEKYGRLYNWFAVNDPRGLAPEGFHIASDEEWELLVNYIYENNDRNGSDRWLKSTEGWNDYEDIENKVYKCNGSDKYGFKALPGGMQSSGGYNYIGENAYFWTSTGDEQYMSVYRSIGCWMDVVTPFQTYNYIGKSVRCIKD